MFHYYDHSIVYPLRY